MEPVASTSKDSESLIGDSGQADISMIQGSKETTRGQFKCSYCPVEARFDFKGAKPPFARQIIYLEECYVMKDPFSMPSKGEVLVLGADCSVCSKQVCLGCSIFFAKRFCFMCAWTNIQYLPTQLHPKIRALLKTTDS